MELQLNLIQNKNLIKLVNTTVDELFSEIKGKSLTEELESFINTSITERLKDKLGDEIDSDEFPLRLILKVDNGILSISPNNLFSLMFLNGFHVSPKLLTKSVKRVVINKSHVFSWDPNSKLLINK